MSRKSSLDETVAWSDLTKTADFGATLLAAPTTLGRGETVSSSGRFSYEVAPLTSASGSLGPSPSTTPAVFPLESFALAAQLSLGSQSSGAGAGKVTFNPLTLTFAPSAVTTTLLAEFALGGSYEHLDLFGRARDPNGALDYVVDEFALTQVTGLAFDAQGGLTVTLQYGGEQIRVVQQTSGAPPASGAPPTPQFGGENAVGDREAGGLRYFVEIHTPGSTTPLSIGGVSLFRSSGFSLSASPTSTGSQSSGAGAGAITSNPLTLDFAAGGVAASLFAATSAANAGLSGGYDQIDVLVYGPPGQNSAGVTDYSFSVAQPQSLDAATEGSVVFEFGGAQISVLPTTGAGAAPSPSLAGNLSGGAESYELSFLTQDQILQGESVLVAPTGAPAASTPSIFQLTGFSFANPAASAGSQSSGAGAGKITFSPLTLNFSAPLVTGDLLAALLATPLDGGLEIGAFDAIAGGQSEDLASLFTFKAVSLASLSIAPTGQLTAVVDYGGESAKFAQQNSLGSVAVPSAANVASSSGPTYYVSFDTAANAALGASQSSGASGATATLFALKNFSFSTSTTATGAKTNSLNLILGQPTLAQSLLQDIASGTQFQSVSVLAYGDDPASGQTTLVSDFVFSPATAQSLALNGQNDDTFAVNYASVSNGPTGGVLDRSTVSHASDTSQITYYVRFGEPTSSTIAATLPALAEITDGQLFELTNFDATLSLNASASQSSGAGAGAGKATFSPLDLSFAESDLTAGLFQALTQDPIFSEVDVLGYDASGNFAAGYDFNLDGVTGLTVSQTGGSQANLVTGGEGTISPGAETGQAPATLRSAQVASAEGGEQIDYYVRFLAQGATTPVDGGDLFALTDWSFTDSHTGPGASASAATLGPLDLTLAQSEIPLSLYPDFGGAATFDELDILGYRAGRGGQTGALVSDYSFGDVAIGTPGSDGAGGVTLVAQYGSQSIQTYGTRAGA
jgi:hypothetical protein